MRILLKEVEIPVEGDPESTELMVYYKEGENFYQGRTCKDYDLGEVLAFRIPHRSEILPIPEDLVSRALIAPSPIPPETYPKYWDYSRYDYRDLESSRLGSALISELRVHEQLRTHPLSSHLQTYYGAILDQKKVVALCFKRYPNTLEQAITARLSINIDIVVDDIKWAARLLHQAGFIHVSLYFTFITETPNMLAG